MDKWLVLCGGNFVIVDSEESAVLDATAAAMQSIGKEVQIFSLVRTLVAETRVVDVEK